MKADENRKHTKLDNEAFILYVLLLSYLVNFIACFFVKFKKQFSLTWEVNLKIKGTCGGQNERYLWWSSVGHCVVFMGKTLYSCCDFLNPYTIYHTRVLSVRPDTFQSFGRYSVVNCQVYFGSF